MTTQTRKKAAPKVKVGGVISDGNGGYLSEGEALPDGCDTESLKAKGLIG